MLTPQQLSALAQQRMHAEFGVLLNRMQDSIEALRVSQAAPADVFRTLGEMQARAMEASTDIIWNAARAILTDGKVQFQPALERQLTPFVLSFVPHMRKRVEDYCRGVITGMRVPEASAAWVAITNSLNRSEQTVRDILHSRVLDYVKGLFLEAHGGFPPTAPASPATRSVSTPAGQQRRVPAAFTAGTTTAPAAGGEYLELELRPAPRPESVPAARSASKRVFVVHGHNDALRDSVTAQLYRLGFDPVVLREHAERGQTIIEKIEQYSDVSFAVVLVTPDDEGRAQGSIGELQPRARQNVIMELGYFVGRLGRGRVCVLFGDRVELPSDFTGVLHIPLDPGGGWKQLLARELLAAGYAIESGKLV